MKGGTHVQHVTDQLVEAISKKVKSQNRGGIEVKPAHVKNHLWVFVNTLIENPAFDSQTKETLTTKQSKLGSTCEISDALMKKVLKSGIVETIVDWAKQKQRVDIARHLRGGTKNTTRVIGIPKLEDANDAGSKNSDDCTLILTEGDSAKSLAVAGLSIVGRDKYGVFPLKGKLLNVRDANFKQVTQNAEIQNLLKIVGLDLKCEYNDVRKLRYGSIMLMTDQDHDGSHIKGLLINMVHHWWPSLIQMDGFLKEFVTPIVKVWKAGKKEGERKEERSFFTINEFQAWRNRTNGGRGWKSKYYKGLGTSTTKEAKEYFRDIENHELRFRWASERDGQAIDLAFNKKRADDRKEWINAYEEGTFVDHSKPTVGYQDFIYKELVQFAKYDVSRSIPCLVDGFKPSQRKVMYCAFKKKLKNDIKVAQFVGYISEQSAYHHGETSLENTIVNLAQTFVGSNNTNLLVPSGQFGTRLQGGKDHAAARYIYTRLSPATRLMFPPDDDPILDYLEDEGQPIEPSWYCPILPLALVNGADGIGVGWSTFIPNYNPRDLINNIRKLLRGQKMQPMSPWYKNFKGAISACASEEGKFEVVGHIEKKDEKTLEITEIPVRKWTQDYKEFLEGMMPGEKKSEESSGHMIEDFREYHTENTVHFTVTMTSEKMKEAEKTGLDKVFKLKSSVSTANMMLFDAEGKIAKYETALDILAEFCKVRRCAYDKRKEYLVSKLTREKEILSNKARFILMVVNDELEIRKKKKEMLLKELQKLKFTPMSELDAIMKGQDKRKDNGKKRKKMKKQTNKKKVLQRQQTNPIMIIS
jgi:DNA topoisomerase-2